MTASSPTELAETTMLERSTYEPPEDFRELEAWTCAWYDELVKAEFVFLPYYPDAATLRRLCDYFHAGLSPAEAAQACFGRKQ